MKQNGARKIPDHTFRKPDARLVSLSLHPSRGYPDLAFRISLQSPERRDSLFSPSFFLGRRLIVAEAEEPRTARALAELGIERS